MFAGNLGAPWSSGAWGPGPNGPAVNPPLGLHQTNATITSFEGLVGYMLRDSWKNLGTLILNIENLTNGLK